MGPFLDVSRQQAPWPAVWASRGLRSCPLAEAGRKFGTGDEFAPGPGDMNQDPIARSERIAMTFITSKRPHSGAEEKSGLFSASLGEVKDEVFHAPSLSDDP